MYPKVATVRMENVLLEVMKILSRNYIELHRNSDHTDPRVQAKQSVLNIETHKSSF